MTKADQLAAARTFKASDLADMIEMTDVRLGLVARNRAIVGVQRRALEAARADLAQLKAHLQALGPFVQRLYAGRHMTPRSKYSFWIDTEQAEGLKAVKERDGVLESEQIRRAINEWLKKKGVIKTERKRADTRKRS